MMWTCRDLNNENIQDEAFTSIIKMFESHLQFGIVQSVQRVTQCLWANIGESLRIALRYDVTSQATQNFHAKN